MFGIMAEKKVPPPPDSIGFLLLCKHRSDIAHYSVIDVMSIPTMKKEPLPLRGKHRLV
jgi:hypothetical protein